MKKLLKTYELRTNGEYYNMILESMINWQYTQAKEQFKAMPRDNRKDMVKQIVNLEFEVDPKHTMILIELI